MSPQAERALAQIRQEALLCPIESSAFSPGVAILRHLDSGEPCDFLASFAGLTPGAQGAVIELFRELHLGRVTLEEVNGYPLPAGTRRPRADCGGFQPPAIWVSLLPKPR